MVVKYCSFSSAIFFRQRSLPSFAFSEMNQPSGRHEVQPVAVHPDPALSHQVPALVLEIVLPDVLAGACVDAKTWSGIVKYRMPSTISGVDLIVGIADAALRSDASNAVHPLDLQPTRPFDWLICSRSLKRRPE